MLKTLPVIWFSHATGIHYTDREVEWAVLRRSSKGIEKIREESMPIPEGFFDREDASLFPAETLSGIRKNLRGIITVSLPSSQLLMRMLELPSVDSAELHSMVELQIDQIAPFPADQLTISYEVLHQTEDHSRVLAVAARRTFVDQLGDLFKEQRVYVRSLDAEALAWWSLLVAHRQVPCEGRIVILLEEHTEFSMIVVDDGIPVHIRSLELFHNFTDDRVINDLTEEVRYALLSLETEYGHRDCETMEFWSETEIPPALENQLRELCRHGINKHDLGDLPSVTEGLALRTAEKRPHHVELVPREWIELQRRIRLIKVATITGIALLSLWVSVVTVAGAVFSFRQAGLNRIRREAAQYEAPARAAQAAREEMLSLETYAERTYSALECLREITDKLPEGIEISSFIYKKGDSVRLRGLSDHTDLIYDYFQRLGASDLFDGIKDQPVNTRMIKDRRVSTFSITAELPKAETEKLP
jgi:hypothetical protein